MSADLVMEPGWQDELRAAERAFLEGALGPDILADMQRAVPIDTGRLFGSLDLQVVDEDGLELQIGSFPDAEGDVDYAAAVELGFQGPELVREHVAHRGFKEGDQAAGYVVREHTRMANTPEQPYQRPALYRTRY